MYAVAAAQFAAVGTTDIPIDQYVPLWGCPVPLISDNGLHFTSKLSNDAFYDRGRTFSLFLFLNEGFLNPKSSECQSCFEK